MKLIAGLGNPGAEYAFTRHNVGWMVVDQLAALLASPGCPSSPSNKFGGEFFLFRGVALLKPHTYMNLSGVSVRQVFDFYKMQCDEVLVVCDDVALPFGKLRIRAKGSAGGHNGLASVLGALGALEVPRLRVGVGGAPCGGEMRNWVLGHFHDEEADAFPELLARCADAVKVWLDEGISRAMNMVNAREKKEAPPAADGAHE